MVPPINSHSGGSLKSVNNDAHIQIVLKRVNFQLILSGVRQIVTMPQLSASPPIALVDDKVTISATGLTPHQNVTVSAVVKEKTTFLSCGHFVADKDGHIDLKTQPSLGGTYTGIDGMGLLWSMRPAHGERTSRLVNSDGTQPFIVDLSLWDSHVGFEELPNSTKSCVLATVNMERWFKHRNVQRVIVRDGDLRGALFLPPGEGPFPGVIDMFGLTGGMMEYRAALLASRGFAAMALAYLGYDDLPNDMNELDLDYFLQAVDWMDTHPAVKRGGVGVYGVSKGAELGMLMAAYSPKVKAVVSINGAQAYTLGNLKRGGHHFLKGVKLDFSEVIMRDDGMIIQSAFTGWEDHLIPIWKSDARFLLICGEADQAWNPHCAELVLNRLPQEKRKNIEHKIYPGAGHVLEPPYIPMCDAFFHKRLNANIVWGGSPQLHALAQEDAWHRALNFLHRNLSQGQSETGGNPVCSRL